MKTKKIFCIIFLMILFLLIFSCSKSDGRGTTTNTQSDNPETNVSQSSNTGSKNDQSKSKVIAEQYRGIFIYNDEYELEFYQDKFIPRAITSFSTMQMSEDQAWTVGNELWSKDYRGDIFQGKFIDINTFVFEDKDGVFDTFKGKTFKR